MFELIVIYGSALAVLLLIVFLVELKRRARKNVIKDPKPVRVICKDPHGLSAEFRYSLDGGKSDSLLEFADETGQAIPAEHRVVEIENAK